MHQKNFGHRPRIYSCSYSVRVTWDAILFHKFVNKLDFETHRQWELSLNRQNCFPSFKDLFDFLELRWQSLEMVPVQKTKTINHQRTTFEIVTKSFHGTPTLINCAENHELYKCPKYLKMNYDERTQCVQKFNLCFNCLRNGHSSAKCRYGQCKISKRRQHSSLHRNKFVP